jgi:hypothetical protein
VLLAIESGRSAAVRFDTIGIHWAGSKGWTAAPSTPTPTPYLTIDFGTIASMEETSGGWLLNSESFRSYR